ncbi:MAG: divergent polysaccharide deacetylase family protein [Atribacterota bacterium]
MEKKFWNYTYSLLLSIILLLLLGIFIHLDGNGNRIKDLPIDATIPPEETFLEEEPKTEKIQKPLLHEILGKKDEDLQLFHQFLKTKDKPDMPKIAIIIDDLGYQIEIAERIMNLKFPVTISILPFLSNSQSIAKMAKEKNMSILLHLPMEPHNSNINPGKGAIYSSMKEEEIKTKMSAIFQDLPGIDGMNNHMGSKLTEDREIMKIILGEIQNRNMFFIDSMTSPNSVGFELSKQMGIKTAHRSVFLDNDQDMDYIRQQIKKLKELALKNGKAIAIGHPYCNTIDVLIEEGLQLQAEGIKIVKLEELLE